MANGLTHIEADGLYVTTVGLDQVAVETARQVTSQEAVKLFTEVPDYVAGSANGLLAHAPHATGTLVYLIDFDGSRDMAAQTAMTIQTLANGRAMMIALSVDRASRADPERHAGGMHRVSAQTFASQRTR